MALTDTDHTPPVDPRHLRRITLVQQVYAHMFGPERRDKLADKQIENEIDIIISHMDTIDAQIQKYAPKYPLDQVAKADLAILRVAVYELTIKKTEPTKVIINEAVELAKEMGSERAFAFVNAVLGAIVLEKPTEEIIIHN
ncbi:MAG: transcription antitermination factor NusB [Candidatus Roizmanbacteria bacterium]